MHPLKDVFLSIDEQLLPARILTEEWLLSYGIDVKV
jgi:hypothetical protein